MKMNKNLQYKNRKYPGILAVTVTGILLSFLLAGCAHIISQEILKEVDKGISFEELSKDPESYKGKTVLLGGVIVKTENRNDGTRLEIYQTDLDSYGRPINTDQSQGRFLAMDERFLDSEIYSAGREVTIAGVVKGAEVMKLGEIDYHYPCLVIREIHLWKEVPRLRYDPHYRYPWYPFWGYPWYPWYYPYRPYSWYYYDTYDLQVTGRDIQHYRGGNIDKIPKRRSFGK